MNQPTTRPTRIQRTRRAGSRMPDGVQYVGRPTAWGNPFRTAKAFRAWLLDGTIDERQLLDLSLLPLGTATRKLLEDRRAWMLQNLRRLTGRKLACWCPPSNDCHADLLLELANSVTGFDPAHGPDMARKIIVHPDGRIEEAS